ncbi:uncharacterized protein FIBRA_03457 [Fibroporia radiculosa]|uniref:Uncharacterized protein n=1 Tax=Fibroporia radiculosa TaxID=599839 RepID=J4I9M2_9APHY|nr:uncharacterized protein FIBRA_03457 [Fibroporia radiculosa]CCM01406.1 predicted protein [Fibroporia radiculosa]
MKSATGTRKPYNGQTRSLALALDIGTTFSGVSYAILEPGEVPKIHGVTRFPGQEHVAGNSKIPSIMYYDRQGKMVAAGAEAESSTIVAEAEDEGWIKAELFKLRLRPKAMKLKMNGMRLAPLPQGKTAVDVFGDFLAYLFRCTRSFIVDTHANGPTLWRAVENDIQFVLSHPNGWEGAQQTKMRRAAVYGGLIPDTDEGKSRIRFVTEGEASLHACVLNGLAADVLQNPSGHGFIVADAGGGTLDISSYAIRGTAPLVIEEIAPPDCVFAGSVFVSRRARAFFGEKLKASKYGTPDSLDHITKRFDETTKRLFRDNKELQFVPFGSPLDKDMTAGIRGGQLKLTGAEVAALFEPSIEAAIGSIKAQIDASGGAVKSVWLVGGFAASPWLFSQLQEMLLPFHVTVSRPDTQTSKAVADGAIGFYCDHHVSARMSKFMYGVEYLREYDSNDEEHVSRQHRLFELPSGPKLLPDAFDCILSRGVKVKESTVFSRKYCTEVTNLTTLSVFEVEIWCYRGGDTIPKWILRGAENFSTLCYVRADLSPLAGSAQSKHGRNGKTYWTIVFSIEIHFGLTEFKARIKWTDNNRTRYGPASIVYNESGHRADEEEPDESPDDNITVVSSQSEVPSAVPSNKTSRAPSRDPVPARSRSTLSTQASPKLPHPEPRPEHSRSASIRSSSRSEARVDKGKEREVAPAMRETDRSLNVSGRSIDSTRSGNTRLGETLSSVWGTASKQQTPLASPLVETARSSLATPRDETAVPTAREMSKATTPKEVSKAPTPKELSRAPTARESRIPTPKELSKVPTPVETSVAVTPKVSQPPTPKEISKPPTPVEVSHASSPRVLSKAPTPQEVSKAPTPKETSKPPTPKASRVPTPKAASKVPTPKATSKAPTPKVASKVATPQVDPEPLAESIPPTPAVESSPGSWPEWTAPDGIENAVVPPPPSWNLPETVPEEPPQPAEEPAPAESNPESNSQFGNWNAGSNDLGLWGESPTNTQPSASSAGLQDLLASPNPDTTSSSGLFSSGWGGWGSKPSIGFGTSKSTFGAGLLGGVGSALFSGGGGFVNADAERDAEKKKAEEEAAAAIRKAEEDAAAARKAEEDAAAARKAEEDAAAARKVEEETAAAADAARQEEEAAVAAVAAQKADEDAAAVQRVADDDAAAAAAETQRAEEEAATAAEAKKVEEAAAQKTQEEADAAQKAGEDAAAAATAAKEAEAVTETNDAVEEAATSAEQTMEADAPSAETPADETLATQTPNAENEQGTAGADGANTTEDAPDGNQQNGDEEVQLDEEVKEEDEWAATGKKNKKKKGKATGGGESSTPADTAPAINSRTNSKQSGSKAGKKGKKK